MLTCMHEVQRLSLPTLLNHILSNTLKHTTHTHTGTRIVCWFFFFNILKAVPGTDGQFHRPVCELLSWVNQTILWGREKEAELGRRSVKGEEFRGREHKQIRRRCSPVHSA